MLKGTRRGRKKDVGSGGEEKRREERRGEGKKGHARGEVKKWLRKEVRRKGN